jgi:hypothetical protein
MRRRSPSLVELQWEKGVVLAGAAVALYTASVCLFQSPNTVRYDGRDLSPRELFGLPDATWRPVRLVPLLPPTQPTLFTGRSLLSAALSESEPLEQDSAGVEEVTWVQIAAHFDLDEQREVLLATGYLRYASNLYLLGMDVQRQLLLSDERFSSWQDVKPRGRCPGVQIPVPVFDDRSGRLLNRAALDKAFGEVKASQALLMRPPLGQVVAGDRPRESGEKEACVLGDDGENGAVLWVHDVGVQPGRTYRYRVRVRSWNRFIGRPRALEDAADAREVAVVGAWSRPSEPIVATPRRHFFVLGSSVGGAATNVEVWTWHQGQWLRKSFVVEVGDVIGGVRTVKTGKMDEADRPVREKIDFGTGVVVLDTRKELRAVRVVDGETGRFEWVQRPTLVVVCLNPADGRVEERLQIADRVDPVRERLRGSSSPA